MKDAAGILLGVCLSYSLVYLLYLRQHAWPDSDQRIFTSNEIAAAERDKEFERCSITLQRNRDLLLLHTLIAVLSCQLREEGHSNFQCAAGVYGLQYLSLQ